jgi:biopolymer transport protein ExbD
MSGRSSRKKGHSFLAAAAAEEQDMTPMMNILIILISFLVTMVVFTHLAVVKFSLPPTQGEGPSDPNVAPAIAVEKPKDLTVVVSESGYQLLVEGKQYNPRPKGPKGYDLKGLVKDLKDVKLIMPFNENVVLLIDSAVLYQDIINTMDICRENQFPKVLLSGGLVQ